LQKRKYKGAKGEGDGSTRGKMSILLHWYKGVPKRKKSPGEGGEKEEANHQKKEGLSNPNVHPTGRRELLGKRKRGSHSVEKLTSSFPSIGGGEH